MPTIYTIGFSGKTKDQFMEILDAVGVRALVDIRLWRVARFVPWASGANLQTVLGGKYRYMPELAPTKELLTQYKDGMIDWDNYQQIYNQILIERQVETLFNANNLDKICFLCTEKSADKCHRKLATEFILQHFSDAKIVHL